MIAHISEVVCQNSHAERDLRRDYLGHAQTLVCQEAALAHASESLRLRRAELCLPRPALRPPAGPGWIHEIKHDGFRHPLMRTKRLWNQRLWKGFRMTAQGCVSAPQGAIHRAKLVPASVRWRLSLRSLMSLMWSTQLSVFR
jgi:hypothetical protein